MMPQPTTGAIEGERGGMVKGNMKTGRNERQDACCDICTLGYGQCLPHIKDCLFEGKSSQLPATAQPRAAPHHRLCLLCRRRRRHRRLLAPKRKVDMTKPVQGYRRQTMIALLILLLVLPQSPEASSRFDCSSFCRATGYHGMMGGCHCGYVLFAKRGRAGHTINSKRSHEWSSRPVLSVPANLLDRTLN